MSYIGVIEAMARSLEQFHGFFACKEIQFWSEDVSNLAYFRFQISWDVSDILISFSIQENVRL
jgi:hypothetical protein